MEERITWEDVPLLLDEVRTMARNFLKREWNDEPMQTTALVLTALRRQQRMHQDRLEVTWPTWENRKFFFAAMYRAMQQALIDHSRCRAAKKRAPEREAIRLDQLGFDNLLQTVEEKPEQIIALEEALEELRKKDPEGAELVEHRYYGGLTAEETARAMGMSRATVQRKWSRVRTLLHDEILRRLNET